MLVTVHLVGAGAVLLVVFCFGLMLGIAIAGTENTDGHSDEEGQKE